ncbi:hypothetical protein [Rhizobium sp. BR 362]|uniref:hypothetical protein n=1 Tax=Rhizobium sp. BR 362 TaxID=3040670 RepID=UPI002F3FCC85
MARVEIKEAAAPAISAVEKFRLVIIIIVILMALRQMGDRKLSAPDVGAVSFLSVLHFWERHLPKCTDRMRPALHSDWVAEAALCMQKQAR